MAETPKVRVLKVGNSAALFVPTDRLVETLKQLGLLPQDWKPKGSPDDGKTTEIDRR